MISAERMRSVRMDRAPDGRHFRRRRVRRGGVGVRGAAVAAVRLGEAEHLEHLRGALVAEKAAADHEKRRDRLRQEDREEERRRQQDEELVADRADGNAHDDRQLARRRHPDDVARRHGGVVDDDAGGLRSRLRDLHRQVVDGDGGGLGERRDIVEECEKSLAHAATFRLGPARPAECARRFTSEPIAVPGRGAPAGPSGRCAGGRRRAFRGRGRHDNPRPEQ
jgi:hypothetical protein